MESVSWQSLKELMEGKVTELMRRARAVEAQNKKLVWAMTKSGFKDWKCSRLNGPGTETHLFHPILKLGELPSLIIRPQG